MELFTSKELVLTLETKSSHEGKCKEIADLKRYYKLPTVNKISIVL